MRSNDRAKDRILRIAEVMEAVGLSRSTIYHLASIGQFPRQVRIGLKAVGWRESEIQAWIESRMQAPEGVIAKAKKAFDDLGVRSY